MDEKIITADTVSDVPDTEEAKTGEIPCEEEGCADSATEKAHSEDDSPSAEEPMDDSTESEQSKESTETKKRGSPKKLLVPLVSILLFIILLFFGAVLFASRQHFSEVGEKIQHPAASLPFCEIVTNLDEIDKDVLGSHTVKLKLFGFFPSSSKLTVRDTTPPELTLREVFISPECEPVPADLLESATDKTALTYEITKENGVYMLSATDEGGNKTVLPCTVNYSDKLTVRNMELGVSLFAIEDLFTTLGFVPFDITSFDTSLAGVQRVHGMLDNKFSVICLTLSDTIAPIVKTKSLDILLGQTVTAEDMVSSLIDVSDVTIRFEKEPDFTIPGKQQLLIVAEDTAKNVSQTEVFLNIHALPQNITVEGGTSTVDFRSLVNRLLTSKISTYPRISDELNIAKLKLGTHTVELTGEYNMLPVELTVVDTTPPELTMRNLSVYIGTMPSPEDFVEKCDDFSPVEIAFANPPDVSIEGDFTVSLIATDSLGNSCEASAWLHITSDNLPPVIYGVKNISAFEGDSISYKSGVWAMDGKDGRVNVSVYSSRVNTKVPGTYYVTYTATDKEGNTAKATATVTIKKVTAAKVNEMADEILSYIITPSMNETQKARAIYDWVKANTKYSTLTSYLMGYYNKAAYSGFTKRYGNCYTYYAVTSALLTRAGINNIEIRRNSTSNPHYWNLVEIGGNWYHLDTCPQPSPHKLEVFLLTDSEVKAFPLSYYYSFNARKYPSTP